MCGLQRNSNLIPKQQEISDTEELFWVELWTARKITPGLELRRQGTRMIPPS
jgi:hypothetical protein